MWMDRLMDGVDIVLFAPSCPLPICTTIPSPHPSPAPFPYKTTAMAIMKTMTTNTPTTTTSTNTTINIMTTKTPMAQTTTMMCFFVHYMCSSARGSLDKIPVWTVSSGSLPDANSTKFLFMLIVAWILFRNAFC